MCSTFKLKGSPSIIDATNHNTAFWCHVSHGVTCSMFFQLKRASSTLTPPFTTPPRFQCRVYASMTPCDVNADVIDHWRQTSRGATQFDGVGISSPVRVTRTRRFHNVKRTQCRRHRKTAFAKRQRVLTPSQRHAWRTPRHP